MHHSAAALGPVLQAKLLDPRESVGIGSHQSSAETQRLTSDEQVVGANWRT